MLILTSSVQVQKQAPEKQPQNYFCNRKINSRKFDFSIKKIIYFLYHENIKKILLTVLSSFQSYWIFFSKIILCNSIVKIKKIKKIVNLKSSIKWTNKELGS